MKTLLSIALIFTVATVVFGVWSTEGNDTENKQMDAYVTLFLGAVAVVFYVLWALGLLFHYLLN